jgi:hypothetical protein
MSSQPVPATALSNRFLDEGLALVVRAAKDVGISISAKTAIRWCLAGVRGVRLESVKVGGRRMTTRGALQRFIAATQEGPAGSRWLPTTNPAVMDRETSDRILASFGLVRSE